MTIPPIHNCIVQWHNDPHLDDGIYLNIFVTDSNSYFYCLTDENIPDTRKQTSPKTYEDYMIGILNTLNPPYLYIPTIATTAEEVRSLHPELLI